MLRDEPQIQKWMGNSEIKFRRNIVNEIYNVPKYSDIIDENSFQLEGFFYDGVGSSVAKCNDKSGTYVIKCNRDYTFLYKEFIAFSLWSKNGVNTPKFLEIVEPQGDLKFAFIVQEFIGCPKTLEIINETYDRNNVFKMIGKNHARMHNVSGIGYGDIIDVKSLKGEFDNFKDFLGDKYRIEANKKILKSLQVDIDFYQDKLDKFIEKSNRAGVLTHNDLGLHNSFLCENKLIIFDGDLTLSHPMIDLAITSLWIWYQGGEAIESMIEGYNSIRSIDLEDYYIAVLISGGYKLEWWYERVKKEAKVKNWIASAEEYIKLIYTKLK